MSKKASTSGARTRKSDARPASKPRAAPDPLLKAVGDRIREVRKERGLSQDNLAYSVPLDRRHLGLIETGRTGATIKTLVKLAVALECEVGDLIPYVEDLLPYADWLDE